MKCNLNEMLNNLNSESNMVFIPETVETDKNKINKNMLIIIPDLKLGGTLTVLLELLYKFKERNYRLFVISGEDGQYREKLLKEGAYVIIRPYVACGDTYRSFLQTAFDLVFINSVACYYYVYMFMNTKVKVLWWIHETKQQLSTMKEGLLDFRLLSSNIQLMGVTKSVAKGINELYGLNIPLLHMPIEDKYEIDRIPENHEKIVFFMPAGITYIKGQDILLKAILGLPKDFYNKAQFVFCGYYLEGQNEYYNMIHELAKDKSNIVMLGELTKEEVYDQYCKSHCILAPSRIDATPTTIVEAMMFNKLCICSNATGISEYMKDCEDGFVFPSENVFELQKRIMIVIDRFDKLNKLADSGRKIYQRYFSPDVVAKQFDVIMEYTL